jgi:hypothetical protein
MDVTKFDWMKEREPDGKAEFRIFFSFQIMEKKFLPVIYQVLKNITGLSFALGGGGGGSTFLTKPTQWGWVL